jgi:hypothetical protein
MRKSLLTVCAVTGLGLVPVAHASMPGAIEQCGRLYNEYAATSRDVGSGPGGVASMLKSLGSLCPDPSESAFSEFFPRTTHKPSDWFTANSSGTCAPVHRMTPAWLIDYDQKRGIVDHTRNEVRNPDGSLASVDVVMPMGDGLELVYHYFHAIDGCTAYQAARSSRLNELK